MKFYRIKWWLAERFNIHFRVPLHLDIELTNHCNLKCTMCRHGFDPITEKGMMPNDMAASLINEAAFLGIPSIKFQFRGESALHKELENFVLLAKCADIKEVQLNTNLVALSEERIENLIDGGLDRLIVSVDGATKETYESIRVGASWDKLVQRLEFFREKNKGRTKLRIQMTQQKQNDHEAVSFVEKFLRYTRDIRIRPASDRGQDGRLLSGRFVSVGRKRCAQPWQRLVIGWNGVGYPCCSSWYDEFPLGNYQDVGIMGLWNSEKMEMIRKQSNTPEKGFPCEKCTVGSTHVWFNDNKPAAPNGLLPPIRVRF